MKKQKNIHGFKAPDNYFENFEESLFSKMDAEKLPKEAGFTAPDGYFEGIEDAVLKRIKSEKHDPKVVSLFSKKYIVGFVAIAACLAIVVSIFSKPEVTNFEDLQVTTIATYISEGNLNLNSYDLIALLNDETITTLTLDTELTSEENIENYLMDALDDNTLLLE